MPQPSRREATLFAANIGFGSVVVNVSERFFSSHVPVYIEISEDGATKLRFHIASRNEMVSALETNPRALVIVRGPDGYISPRWYDHENVPTWDYAFVQLEGKVQRLDRSGLKSHVLELLRKFDADFKVRDEYIEQYLSWIVGFVIEQPQVEPIFKLSQDKNEASIQGVTKGLRNRDGCPDKELAALIEATYSWASTLSETNPE
jgi:transcriptional regulator